MNIKCRLPFAVPSVAVRFRAESLWSPGYVVVLVCAVLYHPIPSPCCVSLSRQLVLVVVSVTLLLRAWRSGFCSCAFARVDLVSAPCRLHGQEVTGARGGADEPRHRAAGVGGCVD